jgi:hypothetical protein
MSTSPAAGTPAPVERLCFRIRDIATATGLSQASVERLRASGKLPPPDLVVGRVPLWRVETIRRWVEGGDAS